MIKRYYDFQSFIGGNDFLSSIDLFFMGNSSEARAKTVPQFIEKKFKGNSYVINYDIENEKYTLDEISLSDDLLKSNLETNGKHLISDFIEDLKAKGINGKNILIDITSLKHPVVFYIILIFKKHFNLKNFFVCYTEPEKYEKSKTNLVEQSFDLTERFCEVKSLPGFLRIVDYSKEKLLVALMGFEGNRFNKVFNEINPVAWKTYAVVGFPSFYPGWQYYVYAQNQNALEQSKGASLIMRTTANEPFGVYEILNRIKKNNPDYEMYVAPIGTKPHSLGASMFAVDNPDVQLYYDFPSYGDKRRTKGVGECLIYNLTDFVNEK